MTTTHADSPIDFAAVCGALPTDTVIRVWQFYDAPEVLQHLSGHGGDEDWVAVIPPGYRGMRLPMWMDGGTAFGCCDVQEDYFPDGWIVAIGAHS